MKKANIIALIVILVALNFHYGWTEDFLSKRQARAEATERYSLGYNPGFAMYVTHDGKTAGVVVGDTRHRINPDPMLPPIEELRFSYAWLRYRQ